MALSKRLRLGCYVTLGTLRIVMTMYEIHGGMSRGYFLKVRWCKVLPNVVKHKPF
jgi:hypothetical protein